MPVFAVLAHTDMPQVARLCRRLSPYDVVLHIDAKTQLYSSDRTTLAGLPNVVPTATRYRINWGGFSGVRAMVDLASQCCDRLGDDEHLVFLSGQCYPLGPVEAFVEYLRSAPFRQHCRAYQLTDTGVSGLLRLRRRHWFDVVDHSALRALPRQARRLARKGLAVATPPRRPRGDYYCGSQWIALTGACLRSILGVPHETIVRDLKNSFAPDEMFFHTLVHRSGWREETMFGGPEAYQSDLRNPVVAYWNYHLLNERMYGFYTSVDELNCLPGQYFVRKVSSRHSAALLDFLDEKAYE